MERAHREEVAGHGERAHREEDAGHGESTQRGGCRTWREHTERRMQDMERVQE